MGKSMESRKIENYRRKVYQIIIYELPYLTLRMYIITTQVFHFIFMLNVEYFLFFAKHLFSAWGKLNERYHAPLLLPHIHWELRIFFCWRITEEIFFRLQSRESRFRFSNICSNTRTSSSSIKFNEMFYCANKSIKVKVEARKIKIA